jgi:acyl carrier protein
MTEDDIRQAVVQALVSVAPEIDPSTIDPAQNFRDQLDIDSMDFLNYVIALHETLHIDIPESDQARLASIDGAVAYLAPKLATRTGGGRSAERP